MSLPGSAKKSYPEVCSIAAASSAASGNPGSFLNLTAFIGQCGGKRGSQPAERGGAAAPRGKEILRWVKAQESPLKGEDRLRAMKWYKSGRLARSPKQPSRQDTSTSGSCC
eukprot:g21102.t1